MVRVLATLLVLSGLLVHLCLGDLYLHMPRGSNNRLNERSANRNNGNRLFDSQNNNRGGYNKGDRTDQAFQDTGNNLNGYNDQYHMSYFMSANPAVDPNSRSVLTIEWTNQHGCGGNEHGDAHKLNCQLVFQYMCLPDFLNEGGSYDVLGVEQARETCDFECLWPVPGNMDCDASIQPGCPPMDIRTRITCLQAGGKWRESTINDAYNCPHSCTGGGSAAQATSQADCAARSGTWQQLNLPTDTPLLRDGLNTNRQEYDQPNNNDIAGGETNRFNRYRQDIASNRGLHETWEWYDECYRRERNRGLFTADQNLRNNNLGYSSAIFTRQNPNNNRRGYECPEERDYWPYWHPSPWRDIAILTDRLDLCDFYRSESYNVKAKGLCRNTATCNNCIKFNNEAQCTANGGNWVMVPAHGIPPPVCEQAPWSRVNHLGNGRHGQPDTFNWTLPYIALPDGPTNQTFRCVVRMRYNISTDDYDAYRVNSSFNQNNGQGIESPVQQNPTVNMGAENQGLRLAINTAQFGRTFQDRSHVFRLMSRPIVPSSNSVASMRQRAPGQDPDFFKNCGTLYNLNVRGKRGNIVQTFPSVEYDFVPNDLTILDTDCVHVQWTGSNTHNNGNPAGDGQAGDAGEGRGGTDRHNFVQLESANFASSFPLPQENNTMFTALKDAMDFLNPIRSSSVDARCATSLQDVGNNWMLRMASVGYYSSFDCPSDPTSLVATTTELNNLLNNAPASYAGGIFQFRYGDYAYMCTRNHNFSNRDQKGVLRVRRNV
eukprot:m.45054 g.45054  ORF g.45054 m.45054 type:complete len:771 (-) comp14625_c0_seq1:345-2657(-)